MMPLIYIVLVNYNGLLDTIECVTSLEKIEYDNFKIIIVDNASNNNEGKILEEKFQKHSIIESPINLGFAGGNNLGIIMALEKGADYVLLLNNDTIVEEDFLLRMLEGFVENKAAGIVGGKILLYDNKAIISHAGGYIDLYKGITIHYGMDSKNSSGIYNKQKEVEFVSGCLMLIKREVLEKVGVLSEDYFMYYEDTDFCLRAKDAGYRIIYSPGAEIYHKVSKSVGGGDSPFFIKFNTKNRMIFMNKFKAKVGFHGYTFFKLYFYVTRLIRYFLYTLRGDRERAKAILDGISEGRRYIAGRRRRAV